MDRNEKNKDEKRIFARKLHFPGRRNIQSQFLFVCLFISMVSLLLLAVIFLCSSYRMTVKSTSEEVAVNLEMASNLLDIQALEVETLARDILNNSVIYGSLTEKPEEGAALYPDAAAAKSITKELKRLCLNNRDIASIYLFNWDGFEYCYRRSVQSTSFSFDLKENLNEPWYKKTMDAKGYEQYFLTNVTSRPAGDGGVYSVSIAKLMLDLATNQPVGLLIINVNSDHYRNVFPAINETEMGYAIADPSMETVGYVSAGTDMTDEIRKVVLHDLKGEGEGNSPYIITSNVNQRTGWVLYHIVKKSHYIESLRLVLISMLMGLLSLFGLSYLLSAFASRKITCPLHQLSHAIREVQDTGYPPKNLVFEEDEVGSIGKQFLSLFQQNEELTEKVTAISVLQKEAELKALQAQINPHFLYNSLSAIYWLSKSGRMEDAAQMSITLSELFKAMVNRNGDDFVTLEEELHYIRQYLYIQNVRFNGRIQISQSIDQELYSERILKLILQPIVENAVIHGLEPKLGEWKLEIKGMRQQEFMIFTIQDNGVGMDVELATRQGYALRNVMRRIQLRYGDSCGCKIVSRIGQGTEVTVQLKIENAGSQN